MLTSPLLICAHWHIGWLGKPPSVVRQRREMRNLPSRWFHRGISAALIAAITRSGVKTIPFGVLGSLKRGTTRKSRPYQRRRRRRDAARPHIPPSQGYCVTKLPLKHAEWMFSCMPAGAKPIYLHWNSNGARAQYNLLKLRNGVLKTKVGICITKCPRGGAASFGGRRKGGARMGFKKFKDSALMF